MIVFIDIDDTICTTTDKDYPNAVPIFELIDKFNRYFDEGHHVVYWTARGSGSGIDWRELTERQLKQWGVRYHELRFGKPSYDIIIDDKAINPTGTKMATELDWRQILVIRRMSNGKDKIQVLHVKRSSNSLELVVVNKGENMDHSITLILDAKAIDVLRTLLDAP